MLCSCHVLLVAGPLHILLWSLIYHTCQFEHGQAVLNLFQMLLEIKKLWVEVRDDSWPGWMCREGTASVCWGSWPEVPMHNMLRPSSGLGFGDCREVGTAVEQV